jgi:hypothetical protein
VKQNQGKLTLYTSAILNAGYAFSLREGMECATVAEGMECATVAVAQFEEYLAF